MFKSRILVIGIFAIIAGACAGLGLLLTGPGNNAEAAVGLKPDVKLVSTILREGTSKSDISTVYLQEITTGSNPDGYYLSKLSIRFTDHAISNDSPRVAIIRPHPVTNTTWEVVSSWQKQNEGTKVSNGEFTYTYINNKLLDPSETYYIAVATRSTAKLSLTRYLNEYGAVEGFRIKGNVRTAPFGLGTEAGRLPLISVSDTADGHPQAMRVALYGHVVNSPRIVPYGDLADEHNYDKWTCAKYDSEAIPNKCQIVDNGDWIIYALENASPWENTTKFAIRDEDHNPTVLNRVIRDDANNETTTPYVVSIEFPKGSDDNSHPPIILKPSYGPFDDTLYISKTLDYETKTHHPFKIKIHDIMDNVIVEQQFIINVIDMPDIPLEFTYKPHIEVKKDSVTAGKRDAHICWDSPWNGARPPILGYNVRYRAATDPESEWMVRNDVTEAKCRNAAGEIVFMNRNDLPYENPDLEARPMTEPPIVPNTGVKTLGYTITGLEPNIWYQVEVQTKNKVGVGVWSPTNTFDTGQVESAPQRTAEQTDSVLLTSHFLMPSSHNESPFTFELHFSEDIPDLSYRTVRNHVLRVANGQILGASRLVKGSNQGWQVTVQPTGSDGVEIALPSTTDCDDAGAICVDGRMMSNGLLAIIIASAPILETPTSEPASAPIQSNPLTASFHNAPSSNDGSPFTLELHFSGEPHNLSWRSIRDYTWVQGGTLTRVERIEKGSNRRWRIYVNPRAESSVEISRLPTTDCHQSSAVCLADGTRLSNTASVMVAYR